MKKIIFLAAIALTTPSFSQAQQPAISQEQMQQMMQQAQQMQTCFAKIDQQALMAFGEKAQAMEAELRSLCQAGKRSEAQRKAIQFGLAMSKDKNIQAARECGEAMQGMAKGMLPKMDYPISEEAFKDVHLCDGF